jgi:hypothetical protein
MSRSRMVELYLCSLICPHVIIPNYIIKYRDNFTFIPCSQQKLPSVAGRCIFVNMCILWLPFHATAVKPPLMLVFVLYWLIFSFLPKFPSIHFLFGLAVPQQFTVIVSKLSYTSQGWEETVHVELMAHICHPSSHFCHNCMWSCHYTSCKFPVLP